MLHVHLGTLPNELKLLVRKGWLYTVSLCIKMKRLNQVEVMEVLTL